MHKIIMVALWNRADHYIFILSFVLLLFFFPRLIWAAADWMSAILPQFKMQVWNVTRLAETQDASRHLGTIAQLCRAISSQLRHVSTLGKKLVNLHMSPQYGELRPISGWDRSGSLRHPCKFQRVSRLGSVTARHLVVGISQTLRCW